jgi:AcrR family transcriptional regulator
VRRTHERGLTARGRARHAAARLPADERRAAILDAALEVFTATSYARATTAAIARRAGISEPILYRHFASKRDLCLACLDEAWSRLREGVAEAAADGTGRMLGLARINADPALRALRQDVSSMWLVALAEAGDDDVIASHLAAQLREVHDAFEERFVAEQARGAVPAERDAYAEAWIVVAGALLLTVAERLGGLLSSDDLDRVSRARRAWLLPDDGP